MTRVPRLSKTRFQAGLRCSKYLWLLCHAFNLADDVGEAQQAVLDQGHAVGALAREYLPGGVLVTEDHLHISKALGRTSHLLSEGFSCLYEAAFQKDGVLVRSDIILKDESGGWSLVEVKSSTKVKPEHLTDLGIQSHVIRGVGLPVTGCHVLHIDDSYVYPGGGYDLGRLFTLVDVTAEVEQFLPRVPDLVREMKDILAGPMPDMPTDERCRRHYICRFYGYCHGVPSGLPSGEPVDAGIAGAGAGDTSAKICSMPAPVAQAGMSEETLHVLVFKIVRPGLPLYPGTRPYQPVPVEWSCDTVRGGVSLQHQEFIHTGKTDPRRPFAISLLSDLPRDGRIVVHGSLENAVLAALADDLPDLAGPITRLRTRLVVAGRQPAGRSPRLVAL